MGCNCGDNEYNITVNNNGNCEPTTPIYNITLANVGVNGYSPIVRFINETVESFNIAVDNVTGTETSPAVPKLSYVADQINDVYTTIAGLGSTYLTRSGNNATLPFSVGNLTLYSDSTTLSGSVNASGYIATGEIRPRNSSGITIGYDNYDAPINLVTANKAYYNDKEIATIDQIPTVGNGTITITQGGITKGTFTTNQSGNSTIQLDGAIIDNPFTVNASTGYSGNAVLYASGAYSGTDAGTRLETIWTDTVESVEHRYTHGLYINNGGRYKEYPSIQYKKEDYIPSTGSGTTSSTDLGFINAGVYSTIPTLTSPIYVTRSGAGYIISLKYDNDTLKVNQDGKLYADVQGGTSYTAGTGINISNDTISVTNNVLMNTATNTGSLVIGGTEYQSPPYVTAIGIGSDAGYTSGTAIGNNVKIYGYGGIAIGASITDYGDDNIAIGGNCGTENDTVEGAIQLGSGTNTISNSLCVGGNYNLSTFEYDNWELLDRTTGKIPNDRINTMVGATTLTGGSAGLVPAPTTSDVGKFLKSDGTWDTVGGGGGTAYTAGTGIDITNDTISVDNTVAMKTDIPTNYVTTDTAQNITGVKTLQSPILNNSTIRSQAQGYYTYFDRKMENVETALNIKTVTTSDATRTDLKIDNVTIYDASTQLIPDARISSNIARVSDIPTNYVTTNTAQTITGIKTFSDNIKTDTVYNTNNNPILQIYNSTIRVGNSNYGLKLLGDSTRPEYSMDSGTNYNQLALLSDIPTVNDSTITFTQGGVTKGTITLNQSSNQTIALDAGGGGGATIDDTTPSSSTVYSSQKTQDLIDALVARIMALEANINGGNA